MTSFTVRGFRAAGVHCGLKVDDKDIAFIASDRPCAAAGVFTTNHVKAAPVLLDEAVIRGGGAVRAVVANAGNANACTGEQGMRDAQAMAAAAASMIGCEPGEVLVLSTGVIGVPMPMEHVRHGIETAAGQLEADGWRDAALAIMTTDTYPKLACVHTDAGYSIGGIAKGAGMIAPNMATMLAVIVTDAAVPQPALQAMLKRAADHSFNRIVVDGDMSTNDTVLLLANGASGVEVGENDAKFYAALETVCTTLTQELVRNAEGATKFVTLHITGAESVEAARAVGNAIATSPLCKTAFYGADPNWGRIIAAAGRAGVTVDAGRMALSLLDAEGVEAIRLFEQGGPTNYDEPAAIALMSGEAWGFRLDLGLGEAETTIWTCDLSHDYVTINGHYRT